MEKTTKGKSRVIAHALKQLVREELQNVIVMGYRWPDMDCFGSGIRELIKEYKVYGEGCCDRNRGAQRGLLQAIYKQAVETDDLRDRKQGKKAIELCEERRPL